ncbi:MAG: 1,2-phenylacetyl-CoA epoxidase subunit PaaD [Pseudomonadota bacterium]
MATVVCKQPMVDELTILKERLAELPDPEIPVLTLQDLGVLRSVEVKDGEVVVTMTPTYSGCPAMDAMANAVRDVLNASPMPGRVETVFDPPWTTDWLSESGRRKLEEYGIAPPVGSSDKRSLLGEDAAVPCPRCRSKSTRLISQFGSTACKALYQCNDCLEPFDYFKCH